MSGVTQNVEMGQVAKTGKSIGYGLVDETSIPDGGGVAIFFAPSGPKWSWDTVILF